MSAIIDISTPYWLRIPSSAAAIGRLCCVRAARRQLGRRGVGLWRGAGIALGSFPLAARPNRTCASPRIRLSVCLARCSRGVRVCDGTWVGDLAAAVAFDLDAGGAVRR